MAGTTKLSVGKVLDKLRSAGDAPKSNRTLLDEKIGTFDEETQRLRAMRRRLEHGSGPTIRGAHAVRSGNEMGRAALVIFTGLVAVAAVVFLTGLAGIW